MKSRRSTSVRALCIVSAVIGAGSLLLFGVFLYIGSLRIVDFGLDTTTRLALDAALCLAFFLQHSVMVRSGFRRRLRRLVADEFHGALYSVVSGLVLVLLVVLWQATAGNLIEPSRPLRWLLRGIFCLALVGFAWSAHTLRELDTFGLTAIRRDLHGRSAGPPRLNVRGPYRWVRHPFYFLSLVLIWTCPDLTADRLSFNLLFTGWILVGTVLEERDLVAAFGTPYRDYQRQVPMLLPFGSRRPSGRVLA